MLHIPINYLITNVTRDEAEGLTKIEIDMDPGFAYMSEASTAARPSQMLYYPGTKWKGQHMFRIDTIVTNNSNPKEIAALKK
ncbi:MAG: hypothetical protein K0R67_2426 [Paenibacillus sp.]|nr:hypothetical protein [Paenibacillus sp.]